MIDWTHFSPAPVVGIDEVGRGCLFGPVVAASVTPKLKSSSSFKGELFYYSDLKSDYSEHFSAWSHSYQQLAPLASQPPQITDSKKLSPAKRQSALNYIFTHFHVGWGLASPQEIDQINILQASLLAMKRSCLALEATCGHSAGHLLIDGNKTIPNLDRLQTTLVQGDLNCELIAMASIAAKVWRDELMTYLDQCYPGYEVSQHKGYPSPTHKIKLLKLGPTPEHRLSFKIKESLPSPNP